MPVSRVDDLGEFRIACFGSFVSLFEIKKAYKFLFMFMSLLGRTDLLKQSHKPKNKCIHFNHTYKLINQQNNLYKHFFDGKKVKV